MTSALLSMLLLFKAAIKIDGLHTSETVIELSYKADTVEDYASKDILLVVEM